MIIPSQKYLLPTKIPFTESTSLPNSYTDLIPDFTKRLPLTRFLFMFRTSKFFFINISLFILGMWNTSPCSLCPQPLMNFILHLNLLFIVDNLKGYEERPIIEMIYSGASIMPPSQELSFCHIYFTHCNSNVFNVNEDHFVLIFILLSLSTFPCMIFRLNTQSNLF